MGNSNSNHDTSVQFSGAKHLCALRMSEDGIITSVKHAAAWDEYMQPITGVHADIIAGSNVGDVIGDDNLDILQSLFRATRTDVSTLRIFSNDVELVVATIPDGKDATCCVSPQRVVWMLLPHHASGLKCFSRAKAPQQFRCGDCRQYSLDNVRFSSHGAVVAELIAAGHVALHRAVIARCRACHTRAISQHLAPGGDAIVPTGTPATRSTALVVSPDPSVATSVTAALRAMSLTPTLVPTAEEAIRRMMATPYDIAVVDVVLPRKSGIDLMQFIRWEFADVPILAVAGSEVFSGPALAVGANAFVVKGCGDMQMRRTLYQLTTLPLAPVGASLSSSS
jgi:CheY-like chemotaxis protein